MKRVLSVIILLSVSMLISGCDDGDDGGSASGYGEFPEVSFLIDEDTGFVNCYNADSNVITTQQICIWNCANYNNKGAVRKVILHFDEALIPTATGVDEETGEITYEYTSEMALVKEDFDVCEL